MSEILNVSAVHNNGKPELRVGIRGKEFILSLDTKTNIVRLKNLFTQKKLSFEVDNLIATNVYTKEDIDNMISGMMTYHGKYNSYQELLNSIENGIITPRHGWVVYILNGGGTDINGVAITNNCHLLYNGERWQVM